MTGAPSGSSNGAQHSPEITSQDHPHTNLSVSTGRDAYIVVNSPGADISRGRKGEIGVDSAKDETTTIPGTRRPTVSDVLALTHKLVGRQPESRRLLATILGKGEGCALLVVGGPGYGKTSVTRHLACQRAVIDRFGERRWFVPLEHVRTRKAFEAALSRSFGFRGAPFTEALNLVAGQPALLILDNLETPWEAARTDTEGILARLVGFGVTLVASMRGADRPGCIAWETTFLSPLERRESKELFLRIADRIDPRDEHLTPMLQELGGIPLAIELMAHQATAFERIEPVLKEWKRVGGAMATRGQGRRDRSDSLDTSIELSLRSPRLTGTGRRLLQLIAELPGGVSTSDLDGLVENAYEPMRSCLATGLAFERDGRLDLLPPIRDHVRRRSKEHGSRKWVRFYTALLVDQPGVAPDRARRLRTLDKEAQNIVHAARTAQRTDPHLFGMISAERLADVLKSSGERAPGLFEELIGHHARSGDGRPALRARMAFGRLSFAQSDFVEAHQIFLAALTEATELGDGHASLECLLGLADSKRPSDTAEARRRYRMAFRTARALGSPGGRARALRGLGVCSLEVAKLISAARACHAARQVFRDIGDAANEATCEWSLAQIRLMTDDPVSARIGFQSAMAIFERIGDARGRANCQRGIGRSAICSAQELARSQRHDEARAELSFARPMMKSAERTFEAQASALGVSECTRSRAEIIMRSGHPRLSAAASLFQKALRIDQAAGSLRGQGFCHLGLFDVSIARSELTRARAHLEAATQCFTAGRIADGQPEAERRSVVLERLIARSAKPGREPPAI